MSYPPNTETQLAKIAWLSAHNPDQVFHSLMHHINMDSLRRCFDELDGRKAVGVDQASKTMYGENLQVNLEELIQRMKRMAYRSKLFEPRGAWKKPFGFGNFWRECVCVAP